MTLWLSEADVRAVLSPHELIDVIEAALVAFSTGRVDQPVRTAIEMRDRTFFASMPVLHLERGVMGAKLVTVVPENAARGLHTHLAAISLFDTDTGELLAVMDGRYITEVRTAAASAVSVKYLARPEARVLAILGSGVQARSHLAALRLVRNFTDIRAWSPNPERLHAFAQPPVRASASAAEAVEGADVIVLATSSVSPAIDHRWIRPGAHVIAIGACRPSQREIDPELVACAHVVVDSKAAALKESGDIIGGISEGRYPEDHVRAEIGEIAAGRRPGRTSVEEITLYKSLGLAIEDLAAAQLAYQRARESNRGIVLSL
jgi:ornithine cyclodeaminase/alanine dehydrogenase-like protein (mu-crystallin family)